MPIYFYRAELSPELISHVLQNGSRLEREMQASLEAFGGRLIKCVLNARSGDPEGFLEFDEDHRARAWNLFYRMEPGIQNSEIERMIDQSDLPIVQSIIDQCREKAVEHRSNSK